MCVERLRSLSLVEIAMVCLALVMLPVVNATLYLAGWQRTGRLLRVLSPVKTRPAGADIDAVNESVRRCVRIAARRGLYRATCLRESLVIWWLLRLCRIDSTLVIGVGRTKGAFRGHAWVVGGGDRATERDEIARRYVPILLASRDGPPDAPGSREAPCNRPTA